MHLFSGEFWYYKIIHLYLNNDYFKPGLNIELIIIKRTANNKKKTQMETKASLASQSLNYFIFMQKIMK